MEEPGGLQSMGSQRVGQTEHIRECRVKGGKFMSENFQRVEKKYLMTQETYLDFLKETEKYIQLDEFGLHTICNIYFDI